jgi:type-F conjugative transfer system pilin assembly protein TrbC
MLHLLPMKIFLIFILLGLGACHSAVQAEDVAGLLERAEQEAEKMTLPTNRFQDEGLRAAQETAGIFHSPEFQERIRCEEQRLEKEIFAGYTAPWQKKTKRVAQEEEQSLLAKEEKVYLFFSSSVPLETMQAYIAAIARTGDSNVIPLMRGWAGGLSATEANTTYFSRLLQKDSTCRGTSEPCQFYKVKIQLQPLLFTQYGITRVPAVVYVHDHSSYRIQGDAGLDYLLERINREAKSSTLGNLIEALGRS